MSTFVNLVLQTVTLFSLIAAIVSVLYSIRNLNKTADDLLATARAQKDRLDALTERVRVLESQRLTLADYRSLRESGEIKATLFALGQQQPPPR